MVKLDETAATVAVSPLVRRLGSQITLSAEECAALEQLQARRAVLHEGQFLVRDGELLTAAFILCAGAAIRYRITMAGRRQILGISLPGDAIGLQVNFQSTAIADVAALCETEVALIEPERILDLYRHHPVLAAGIDWLTVYNFNILSEHNVSLGARPARERVLHFLLELWSRLAQIGVARPDGFDLPLTQRQIADAMGLSVVHTNKTLKRLAGEGLLELCRRVVRFPDLQAAMAAADFDPRFLQQFRPARNWRSGAGGQVRRFNEYV